MSKTFKSLLEEEAREDILDSETHLTIYKYIKPKEFLSLYQEYRKFSEEDWYISFSEYLMRVVVEDRIYEDFLLAGQPKHVSEKHRKTRSTEQFEFS